MKTPTIQPSPGEIFLPKGTKIIWTASGRNVTGVVLRAIGHSTDTNLPIYEIKLDRQITRHKRFIFMAHTCELKVVA